MDSINSAYIVYMGSLYLLSQGDLQENQSFVLKEFI